MTQTLEEPAASGKPAAAKTVRSLPGISERSVDWAGAAVLVLAAVLVTWQLYAYSYDDAYITYRYAAHFAQGHGLVYSPGDTHLGTTTPLYALLLGVLGRLNPQAIPIISGWLNGAALLAAGLAVFVLARRYGQRFTGLTIALLFIFSPLALETFGGEAIPLAALALWGFVLYDGGFTGWAGLLMGLAALTRGEAVIPLGIIGLHYLITRRRIPWRMGLAFAVPLAMWAIFALARGGSILPDTLSAKTAQTDSGRWPSFAEGLLYLFGLRPNLKLGGVFHPLPLAHTLLAALGFIAVWKRSRYLALPLAWPALHALGYTLIGAPAYHWYYVPVMVGVCILIGAASAAAAEWVSRWAAARVELVREKRLLRFARNDMQAGGDAARIEAARGKRLLRFARNDMYVWVAPALGGLVGLTLLAPALPNLLFPFQRRLPGDDWRLYHATAEWLLANTAPEDRIGYLEVGIIGYFSGRPMVDPLGLVTSIDPEHIRNNDMAWAYRELLPEWIISSAALDPFLAPFKQEPWFANCYTPVGSLDKLTFYRRCAEPAPHDRLTLVAAQNQNDRVAGELTGAMTIGQTFTATQDGLRSIGLLLATYQRELSGPLIFHLQRAEDAGTDRDLATIAIDLATIADNEWRLFSFAPIANSAGQQFYFYLEAPQSAPGAAITAWAVGADRYPGGELRSNHQPQPGDLAFLLYFVR